MNDLDIFIAVALVTEQGYKVSEAARSLGILPP